MPKSIDHLLGFFLYEKGENVTIRGIQVKAIIIDVKDKIDYHDDKMIRTDIEIYSGDKVDYQGNEWIIISEVDKNRRSYKARIRKINYSIKIVVDEVLCNFISIIEGKSLGIENNKYMNLEKGSIQVTIPADSMSNPINTGMRFIKMDKAWKIVGIDKSRIGLNILYCEIDIFGNNDDRINEIADINKIAVWEIQIDDGNRYVAINKNYTYTAIVKKNGSEFQGQTLIWETSNENIAVVNDGMVNGIIIGNVVISVYIEGNPTVIKSMEIEIKESVEDVIVYKMWSANTYGSDKKYTDFSVRHGCEKVYGIEKYVNGALSIPNETYSFSLDANGAPSNKYTYSVIDEYKVKIKADSNNYTVILTGVSDQSGEIVTQSVQFKSSF